MQRLTDQGWQKVLELSQRYGVSADAVQNMLQAVMNGGGTMAQFNIQELGGGGQWMQGGMTMVGDMFNHGLKSKVDGLCYELSQLLLQQPFMPPPPPPQRSNQVQSQGGGNQYSGQQQSSGSGSGSNFSLFVPGSSGGSGSWYPAELGSPNGSGGQNNSRYAYFNNAHRLAVEINGTVTVYDTLDHQIGGVSQQQSGDGSLTLTSQYGMVNVSSLPVISINGVAQQQASQQNQQSPVFEPQNFAPPPTFVPQQNSGPGPSEPATNYQEVDVFAKIERLAELKEKGIVSPEEFAAKKAELLARL